MKISQGKVFIFGGGPTALALAKGLKENQIAFSLFERDKELGGLAKTVCWDGVGFHDLGPHKIFTLDKKLMERVRGLIDAKEWIRQPKISTIYLNNVYLPYPPSPFSLIRVFGPLKFFTLVWGYLFAMIRTLLGLTRTGTEETFEQDLLNRVGNPLYRSLFFPIAIKLWGNPKAVDAKLSRARVQTPKVSETVKQILKVRSRSTFEALEFDYPKGGLSQLWNAIEHQSGPENFHKGYEISNIRIANNRIVEFSVKNIVSGEVQVHNVSENDFVFSTLPVERLIQLSNWENKAQVLELLGDKINHNDLHLIFLYYQGGPVFPESWVFVPDPSIVFHRVSEQKSFDPEMVSGGTIVCCEVMENPDRPLKNYSEDNLIKLSVAGINRLVTGRGQTERMPSRTKVIRLPRSYPVFRPGFEPTLQEALARFDSISNLKSIGRQGAINYIGTLDSMDIGFGAARWFSSRSINESASKKSWEHERQRSSFYPILD